VAGLGADLSGGAIIVEVVYRIFLIPLLLCLISNIFLRGRKQEFVFWVTAVLTSLLEPASQDLHAVVAGPSRVAFACVFAEDYALNLLQAWLFRRNGFLSAIWLRVIFVSGVAHFAGICRPLTKVIGGRTFWPGKNSATGGADVCRQRCTR
jgi:hypothetical protein